MESSGSATGWHIWVFFEHPVRAAKVRKLLFAAIPTNLLLHSGVSADAEANKGLEVFPKQDHIPEDGVGNPVWLPWHHAAKPGGNQFHRLNQDGDIVAFDPADFETVTEADVDAALTQLAPPKKRKAGQAKPLKTHSALVDGENRVAAETLLNRARRKRATAATTPDSG